MAKSKFSAGKKTRPKRKRATKPRTGSRGNAWKQYVGGGGGGRYTPSSEPIPD
jgi:hypothetical protein